MSDLDVVTVGSAVLDHHYTLTNLPEPDGGAFVRDRSTAVGGVAANVASGLAALGRSTGLISRLGADTASDIETPLRDRGVDLARVRTGSDDASYAMILRGPEGDRMVVAGGDSVPNLRLEEEDLAYCRDVSVVFTSAYAPDPVVERVVTARETGSISTLVFDLAGPLAELDGRGTTPATIDRAIDGADLFIVGEVAARSYFGGAFDETLTALATRDVRRAAVTRGADGAILVDGPETVEIPAFDVSVADTTGAGDAFTAGLIHEWLLEGEPAPVAGRFAAGVAALNCTVPGARGSLPTATAVRAFLDDH